MMKWLFESKADAEKKKGREDSLKAAIASSEALEKAAKGTMYLAEDVTRTLQAKIDDYTNQIEQTARILNDALVLVDTKGIIESFNPAAEKMFGWKRRKMMGENFTNLFQFNTEVSVDEKFMESFVRQVNEDSFHMTVNHEEFMGVKADGQRFYVDVTANKLTSSDRRSRYIILIRNVTHRVNNAQMIKNMAEKNQELITTLDSSNTGFIVLEKDETDHRISFVNEGFARMVEKRRADIKIMNLRDLLGVDEGFWNVRRTLTECIEGRHEVQLAVGSKQMIWFDIHITPVFKEGSVTRWVLVFYDTTALKRAYHDLHKTEAHFRAFSDASSESMIIYDKDHIIDWNDRAMSLTGYSPGELAVMNPFDLLHPLHREEAMDGWNHENTTFETIFLTKNGEVKEVAINNSLIDWDNAQARIAIIRDVSRFKDIETQLKTSRERYKTFIDNTIDLVVCFNEQLEITFVNQTFRDYFDVEIQDLNGYSLLDIIPKSDHAKFRDYMLAITPDNAIRRGIHRVERDDGYRWQDWIDRGIFDDAGTLIEIQSVARDVTHLIKDQQA